MIAFFIAAAAIYQGDHNLGEIEIISDSQKKIFIEETQAARLLKKGLSPQEAKESSRTGIVAEDIYWIWERDPVLFPSGAVGTYNRLSWKVPGGVAVLPILPDGKIALNLNFRHATRSWELELPRGGTKEGESSEEAARRELEEETGLKVSRLTSLGSMAPDTGVLSTIVPVYAGWVEKRGTSQQDESEAIAGIRAFSYEELEAALERGYIVIESYGKVPIRDSFLTFALFQVRKKSVDFSRCLD